MKQIVFRLSVSLFLIVGIASCVAPITDVKNETTSQESPKANVVSPQAARIKSVPEEKSDKAVDSPALTISPREKLRNSFIKNPLQRGETLSIEFPTLKSPLIKQVIAIAGDRVFVRQGELIVNGEVVEVNGQTYIIPKEKQVLLGKQLLSYGNTIPKDQFIAFSDEHKRSYDSSDYGLVNLDQVVARLGVRQD